MSDQDITDFLRAMPWRRTKRAADELQPQEDESTYDDWELDLIEYDQQEEY